MPTLLQNACYIPEDDLYLVSSHVHDYVEHTFRDGLTLAVDGGREYARRVGDLYKLNDPEARYEEYCLSDADSFERIADRLLWGSRGKDGDQPLTFRPIKEWAMKSDGLNHLQAILDNANPSPWHRRVIEHWIDVLTGQLS